MPGPAPKPRDQRIRRNRDEGTTSTSVELPSEPLVEWLDDMPVATIELRLAGGRTVRAPAPPTRSGESLEFAAGFPKHAGGGYWELSNGERVGQMRRDQAEAAEAAVRREADLLPQSRRAWEVFWCTPEASMMRPHHLPALERLVLMYDEEERVRRRVFADPPDGRYEVDDCGRIIVVDIPLGMDGPAKPGEQVLEYDQRVVRLPGYLGRGSQGQIVEAPEFKILMKLRSEIRQLEDRFAGSPMAEFKVGWQQAAMLNERARARESEDLAAAAAALRESHQRMIDGGEIVDAEVVG